MSKVLTLDYENEHEYILIGIHATLEDYRLAFHLNEVLSIHLKRESQDLDFSTDSSSFSLYFYDCNHTFSKWALIANKYKFDAHINNENYLFKEDYQMTQLIQEKKQVDFFLKIESDFDEQKISEIIKKVNTIKNVITSYNINPQTLKSKDFLIF